MLRSVLLVALVVSSAMASAQIFECTDAKGNKEYSRHCPPGTVQEREVVNKTGEGMPDSSPQKSIGEQEVEFRKRLLERQEAEAKAEKEKADAEVAQQNCVSARGQLKALEDGQRIGKMDPDTGERTIIGDDERAGEIERARKSVEVWCK